MKKLILFFFTLCYISAYSQNTAINLNGTDAYADLGTINPTANFSGGLTIECWIKWGAFNAASSIIDMGNGADQDNILICNASTGASSTLTFATYNGSSQNYITSSASVVTDQWYHIAVTQTGAGLATIYINGVSAGSGTIQLPSDVSRSSCYIGKSNWPSDGYLNGAVDEMRIWNVARTQAEIKQDMFKSVKAATTGLVAYYRSNEGSGSLLSNSCTNPGAGNATVEGGYSWNNSPIQFAANALNFDGADDYAVIPKIVNSDFTVEYWMKTTATGGGNSGTQWYGGNGIVDAEVPGATNDWGTSLTGAYLAFGVGNPDITIHSTSAVNTGDWVHVAATWQQSTGQMKLYINGNAQASATGSKNARTAPTRITFGELQTSIQHFNGSLDEVRIWNEVRSQSQIQADMNNELDPSAEAQLQAYYIFDQGIAGGDNTGLITLIDQKGINNGTLYKLSLSGSTSNYVDQNSAIVLPLKWLSFIVQPQGADALLRWSTAAEQNTQDFVAQHSTNGKEWDDLGIIMAAGNSNQINTYSYLDINPSIGNNYYRLKQIDLDGKYSFSNIAAIRFDAAATPFGVLSNPVTDGVLKVRIYRNEQVLSLFNINGKILWTKQLSSGTQDIPTTDLAKGIYLLKAGKQVQKIIIQ